MAANFALGLQQGPNAGDRFAAAFQQGMAQNAERAKRQAMAALLANPNDPKALEELGRMDPQAAMQFRGQQQQAMQQQLEAHRENVIKGAQLIRQLQPKDDASWQQALAIAQQAGIDVSEVPPHFDQQYVQGITALADTFAPEKQAGVPNIAKEVDYYRSIGRDDLAQQLLTNHANPMIPINNGDGTITLARPPIGGAGAPPPPPPGFVIDNGGQTGSAPSGGF